MACKFAIEKAVIKKTIEESFQDYFSFSVVNYNMIKLNNILDNSKTKAISEEEANEIINERIKYIEKLYNGYVEIYKHYRNEYDVKILSFDVNEKLIDDIYYKQPFNERNDPKDKTKPTEQEFLMDDALYENEQSFERELQLENKTKEDLQEFNTKCDL